MVATQELQVNLDLFFSSFLAISMALSWVYAYPYVSILPFELRVHVQLRQGIGYIFFAFCFLFIQGIYSLIVISIRREYLQYLWLSLIVPCPIHEMYLSVSGYIDTSDIGSILDHLQYIGRVLSLYSIHYRSFQFPRLLLIKNTAKVMAAETARISNILFE